MSTDSEKPVMLIAGGSGSIGSEIAALAANAGWRIALHGRTLKKNESIRDAIRERVPDARVSLHTADFRISSEIQSLVSEVGDVHGRIDAIVDCSVTGPEGITGLFADTNPEVFSDLAEQSVVAFQRLSHAGLPWLRTSRGSITALVSDAAIYTAPRQSLIGAMRGATVAFIRNLAKELAQEGIRINAISPSFVEGTSIVERLETASRGRLTRARQNAGLGLPNRIDIARLVLFLASADAARITGQVISVNGGLNT
jgi:NAD(P)-dependent dehydrogenase (short-subunit alcohol dehydrogenase family)